MGAQLRLLRRRIKSVKSTAKITRAQELIASSRIVKAQLRMQAAVPYEREITRAVTGVVSNTSSVDHPLTVAKERPTKAAVLIVTSDSGFCGGFNANVLREAEALGSLLKGKGIEPVPFVTGRKGVAWHSFRNRVMEGQWTGFSRKPAYSDAKEIADALIGSFSAEDGVDEIHIVSTQFVSMLTQEVVVRRILPLEIEESTEKPDTPLPYFEFEPSAAAVLDSLLPRAAALCGVAHLHRVAPIGGLRGGLAPPGHEVGDRQRQRAHPSVHPADEPGSPGRDHPGNQRDRRWRERAG
jgi:F-type H+-transporting ATPase subunit gamma